MTAFEILRLVADPFLPPLAWWVRRDLRRIIRESGKKRLRLIDIGARRSPYTIALPADVMLLDVPRVDEVQHAYDLGLVNGQPARLRRRRSNVTGIVIEDFLQNTLPDDEFDIAVAVEVIEHIHDDRGFLRQMARIVSHDGVAYLTTPNGDKMPTPSPQHVRHYTRQQLAGLCREYFEEVDVQYRLRLNRLHRWGHEQIGLSHPVKSALAMSANAAYKLVPGQANGQVDNAAHLVVIARRPRPVLPE
jgi:SAM-dependent methyltransferase